MRVVFLHGGGGMARKPLHFCRRGAIPQRQGDGSVPEGMVAMFADGPDATLSWRGGGNAEFG